MHAAFAAPAALPRRFSPAAHCRPRRPLLMTSTASLQRQHIALPTRGLSLELLSLPCSDASSTLPPVLFLPGSLHAAWCWEGYMREFARVTSVHAVSFRGYTSRPPVSGTVCPGDVVADIVELLGVARIARPVLVGHSYGGYVAQRVGCAAGAAGVSGLVLLASMPPDGNRTVARRVAFRAGLARSWRMTMGFVRKTVARDAAVCREMFFTLPGRPMDEDAEGDAALARYMELFRRASGVTNDLKGATPLGVPARDCGLAGKVLVVGGTEDVILDTQAFEETAAYWEAGEGGLVVLPDRPHDLMLATGWRDSSSLIISWLRKTYA